MTTTPTFQDAVSWTTEWMTEKHPFPELKRHNVHIWCNDNFMYRVITDKSKPNNLLFIKDLMDGSCDWVFKIIIPPTKEEFFTLLNILDK